MTNINRQTLILLNWIIFISIILNLCLFINGAPAQWIDNKLLPKSNQLLWFKVSNYPVHEVWNSSVDSRNRSLAGIGSKWYNSC